MEHYFTNNSQTEDKIKTIEYFFNEEKLEFLTNNAVFSKSYVDFGSDFLNKYIIENVTNENKKLLDLGCGYGAMGLTIGHFLDNLDLTLVDINERAVELCKENAKNLLNHSNINIIASDKFENVTGTFDIAVTNPPIRTGKQNVFAIYEGCYEHLNPKGELYVIIQKKQGALSSKDKLTELFGNCSVVDKKSGYMLLHSVK